MLLSVGIPLPSPKLIILITRLPYTLLRPGSPKPENPEGLNRTRPKEEIVYRCIVSTCKAGLRMSEANSLESAGLSREVRCEFWSELVWIIGV